MSTPSPPPQTQPTSSSVTQAELAVPLGRRGPWFAAIWLFFLVQPLADGWQHRDSAAGVTGLVATVAFAGVYLHLWLWVRRLRHRHRDLRLDRWSGTELVLLLALGGVMTGTLGQDGTAAAVYVAVMVVVVLRTPVAAAVVGLLALGLVVAGATVPGWTSGGGLALSVGAASIAMYGITQMLRRNLALLEAQRENAALAVENERTRFARDLHDILGHSLTVITVKAELAGRLLDRAAGPDGPAPGADSDPADLIRARSELADLERLSRDALADVRRAVAGYRDLSLPGSLAQARAALAAAEIEADLPRSTDAVPTHLRELFAWTVREGVTNVIRHSGAGRCQVVLEPDRVEVRDDGRGACPPLGAAGPAARPGTHDPTHAAGHGLVGLRERAEAVGATVVTRTLDPGFSLSVVVP
ncbi:MAG: histidine kinase [Marmoricola sp.]|nr:histidine kinase [Marmoricola sp.]